MFVFSIPRVIFLIFHLLALKSLSLSLSLSQVKIETLVTAMGGVLHPKASLDVSFVIVKNVLAAKYKVWYLCCSIMKIT